MGGLALKGLLFCGQFSRKEAVIVSTANSFEMLNVFCVKISCSVKNMKIRKCNVKLFEQIYVSVK